MRSGVFRRASANSRAALAEGLRAALQTRANDADGVGAEHDSTTPIYTHVLPAIGNAPASSFSERQPAVSAPASMKPTTTSRTSSTEGRLLTTDAATAPRTLAEAVPGEQNAEAPSSDMVLGPPITETPQSGTTTRPHQDAAFTAEQLALMQLVRDGASLFIGGKAGTGKSYLLREMARQLSQTCGVRVAVTASTGVAALNIDGNTFHSTFGVPVVRSDVHSWVGESRHSADTRRCAPSEANTAKHERITFDAHLLATLDVIIIDEVSMLHAGYLEALERAARLARRKDRKKAFGGIQLILSGDFMQLTPFSGSGDSASFALASERLMCRAVSKGVGVEKTATPCPDGRGQLSDMPTGISAECHAVRAVQHRLSVSHYCQLPLYASYVFQHALLHTQLTQPVRQVTDPRFVEELNELRRGRLPFRLSRCAHLNPPDPDAVRLFAVKNAVRTFNEKKLLELDGEELTFRSELHLREVSSTPGKFPAGKQSNTYSGAANIYDQRVCDCSNSSALPSTALSQTALLHVGTLNASGGRARRRTMIADGEVAALVKELCKSAALNVREVRTCVIPFAVPCSAANVSSIGVRFCGANRAQAQKRLLRFLRSADDRISTHSMACDHAMANRTSRTCRKRLFAAAQRTPPMFPSCPRWQLIRYGAYASRQLMALLQPGFYQRFHKAVKSDAVLQTKTLKVGCRVMLLRNLSPKYVNGSLGTVVAFLPLSACASLLPTDLKAPLPPSHRAVTRSSSVIVATPPMSLDASQARNPDSEEEVETKSDRDTASGHSSISRKLPVVRMDAAGGLVAIPWVLLPLPAAMNEAFFAGRVACMPLTPAYAFTVHRIQGVTLEHSVLFDGDGMFPCDHLLYVAASRVRSFDKLRWVNVSPRMITVHRPSLEFSESLPSTAEARRVWDEWRAGGKSGGSESDQTRRLPTKSKLFLPTWQEKEHI